ncbi:heterokaryon incompatibility protein-domain-containing protein [Dactylonectria estremocensis]|uniref:Heterokaryon incompatibility protein-domain-containing protein n=1 Tax=Dactylonectria estremocensis TaxID=1079267 RepID=A0A9P9ESJ7_9HYPO|nr:heterokaryon incompatibility protein-domain-containing protein [Dactylonectria estremocensis]
MSSTTRPEDVAMNLGLVEYESLDLEKGEIRLATLLPGSLHDPIRLSFRHAHLPIPEQDLISPTVDSESLESLRETLPRGWRAEYTLEGKLLFWKEDGSQSSWTHPDPTHPFEPARFSAQVPLDTSLPTYEALSYCWGERYPEETIFIESNTPPFTMPAQPNLVKALRHLRRAETPRTLWIDAVCINQYDKVERGRHVARMGSIYALAPRVVTWLGPATPTSDEALDELGNMGRQIEITASGSYRAPEADHPDWAQRYPCTPDKWNALSRLFWDHACISDGAILQCGSKTISWYLARRALRLLRETVLPDASMRKGLYPSPVMWLPHAFAGTSTRDWDSLSYLMRSTSQSGCTDPRDRVYALLGLVPKKLADKIVPDYDASAAQVFQNAFLAFLQVNSNLILLKFCDNKLRSETWDGPSWVPDWQVGVTVTPQQARAAGGTKAEARLVAPRVLGVVGVTAARDTSQLSTLEIWDIIKAWYTLWETSPRTSTGIEFFTALRYGWVWERRNIGVSAREYDQEYRSLVNRDTQVNDEDLVRGHLLQDMVRDEKNCTFFCNQDGMAGMGPVGMASGDIVAVLLGCPHPIILRAVTVTASDKSTDTAYQVIGHAYVNGLMESQAILGPLPSPWEIRVDHSTGKERWIWYNPETKELSPDFRYGDLPAGWTQAGDGTMKDEHGHVQTEDPRESIDALKARGVQLETFQLH